MTAGKAVIYVLSVALCMMPAVRADAYSRAALWNAVNDPQFPVVPVYGCPGRFATYFPNFPWDNIKSNALAAMNEWFVDGGAHVRMRYQEDLADTDSRCTNESPDTGTILISAEQNNGNGNCNWATTFYNFDGSNNMTSALVIMHAGTVCNGPYQAFDWATNADYPQSQPDQVDFYSVFLHELGHALGFNHSADTNAVMFAFGTPGDVSRRTLGHDDVQGLFNMFPYSPTQLSMFNVWTNDNGVTWSLNGMGPTPAAGGPAACINNDTNSDTYQGAYTTPFPNQTVTTFTFRFVPSIPGAIVGSPTEKAPGIACGSDRTLYAWVDASTLNVNYRWEINGSWSGTSTLQFQSGVPPAAVEVHNAQGAPIGYLLAFMDRGTGYLRTVLSTDNLSFPTQNLQLFDLFKVRSFAGFGIACQPNAPQCVVTYADGRFHNTPMTTVTVSVTTGSNPTVNIVSGPTAIAGSNGYGGAVQFTNLNGQMSAWRDRGRATVLASTTAGPINWATSFIMHTPPTLSWANSYQTYAAFYAFAGVYDTGGGTVTGTTDFGGDTVSLFTFMVLLALWTALKVYGQRRDVSR